MSKAKGEGLPNKKSSIEQSSFINEIIKRDNKFRSINKVFTLNVKRCIK